MMTIRTREISVRPAGSALLLLLRPDAETRLATHSAAPTLPPTVKRSASIVVILYCQWNWRLGYTVTLGYIRQVTHLRNSLSEWQAVLTSASSAQVLTPQA